MDREAVQIRNVRSNYAAGSGECGAGVEAFARPMMQRNTALGAWCIFQTKGLDVEIAR